MLLDEPLAALDLSLRRRLLPFLRRLNEEFQIPAIIVSHDPVEVQALCGDLIVLHDGKMIARGDPNEVLTDSAVYSMAEQGGFENVLPGMLLETNRGTSQLRLLNTDPAIELTVGSYSGPPMQRLYLGLPARDIMLSNSRPEGLSARNILPGKILALRDLGCAELVTVSLGPNAPQLTVEVTLATVEQLGLEVDRQVFLVFKATSCRLYGDH
jgi:molybdate transport system ATP-binding protein